MAAKKMSAKASGGKKMMRPVPTKAKAKAKRRTKRGVPAQGGNMGRGRKTY